MRLVGCAIVVSLGLPACRPKEPTHSDVYDCATEPTGKTDGPDDLASISLGRYGACGLDADGHATCWGCAADGAPPHDTRFANLDLEYDYACGVTTDGGALCWAWGPTAPAKPYSTAPAGHWASVAVGEHHTCWIDLDGAMTCVGDNGHGEATVPDAGPWASVAVGQTHTCGIDRDGCGYCWGDNMAYQLTIPEWGCQNVKVDAGYLATIWLASDTSALSYGDYTLEDETVLYFDNALDFGIGIRDVSAGEGTTRCALGNDRAMTCFELWEPNSCPQPTDAPAVALDTAWTAMCAILDDRSTLCWGEGYPQDVADGSECIRGNVVDVFGL